MPWDFVLILLVLGIVVPLLGRRRIRHLIKLPFTSKLDRLTLYASTFAFQWATAGLILWRADARSITLKELAIGIPRPALTLTLSVVLSVLFFANQILSLKRLSTQPANRSGVLVHLATKIFPQDSIERLAFVALVIAVAFCEEFIYRGFIQSVFQRATGAVSLGIIVSAVFFASAHLYQGRLGLASTFAVGLLFAAVRSWSGSLAPSISVHFVTDLTVGFLAPIRTRTAPASSSAIQRTESAAADRQP